jgi:DNA-directed RNA polymerase specialized sigma24 family protein
MMSREEFTAKYERGFSSTWKFLESRCVPAEQAYEIAQAAWTRGWECRLQLRDETVLETWVNAIAWNCFLNQKRRAPLVSLTSLYQPSIENHLDRNILAREVLAYAPAQDQHLLHAWCFMGYSDKELAQLFRMAPGAIRARLHRARRRLITVCKAQARLGRLGRPRAKIRTGVGARRLTS